MMLKRLLVVCLCIPAIAAAQESEFGPNCVDKDDVQGLWLISEQHWAFIEPDSTVHLQFVEKACPVATAFINRYSLFRRMSRQSSPTEIDLEAVVDGRAAPFLRQLRETRNQNLRTLCPDDEVTFLAPSDTIGLLDLRPCILGQFHELSEDEARLLFADPAAVISSIAAEEAEAGE